MRRIPLKTVDIEEPNGTTGKLVYADNLISLACYAPTTGIGFEEMEPALAIARAIKAAAERGAAYVILEEAQHAYLVQRVRTGRFSYITAPLHQYLCDVLEAEQFEPNAAGDPGHDPGRLVPRVGPIHAADS